MGLVQNITFQTFSIDQGNDPTGVPTQVLTANVTTILSFVNPSKYFGFHVSAPDVTLSYQQIIVAEGEVKTHFYVEAKSSSGAENGLVLFLWLLGRHCAELEISVADIEEVIGVSPLIGDADKEVFPEKEEQRHHYCRRVCDQAARLRSWTEPPEHLQLRAGTTSSAAHQGAVGGASDMEDCAAEVPE